MRELNDIDETLQELVDRLIVEKDYPVVNLIVDAPDLLSRNDLNKVLCIARRGAEVNIFITLRLKPDFVDISDNTAKKLQSLALSAHLV